ncbi:DUF2290 domain-containing protein [uncultured Draconibacterium sp.]|uniref:DUF2290 domain-containing protein n=1 Tax=uncultured Draconibacterium sp. TaxID=1573823 RepID=UPI003261A6DF
MVGLGKVSVQFNNVEKILKETNLLSERNYYPEKLESHLSELRLLDYEKTWKHYLSNSHYNFQLSDNSLFHFTLNENKPSYAFLGCPYECLNYKDFLKENDFDFDEVGESFYSDYENYLDACPIKVSPMTMRFDYDESSYNEGLHPASHIHIGFNNHIRIGFKTIIDPFAFFCFVIRNVYPEIWSFLLTNSKYSALILTYKEKLEPIESKHYNKIDEKEFYLV